MCFSNLPVEFDDQGNPYLADEADDVQRTDRTPADDAPLDEDPREAYAAIVQGVPEPVRTRLGGSDGTDSGRDDRSESARGD